MKNMYMFCKNFIKNYLPSYAPFFMRAEHSQMIVLQLKAWLRMTS